MLTVSKPAVNNHRMVASSDLDACHLTYHTTDSTEVRTLTIRTPVGYVQLHNLMSTTGLYT